MAFHIHQIIESQFISHSLSSTSYSLPVTSHHSFATLTFAASTIHRYKIFLPSASARIQNDKVHARFRNRFYRSIENFVWNFPLRKIALHFRRCRKSYSMIGMLYIIRLYDIYLSASSHSLSLFQPLTIFRSCWNGLSNKSHFIWYSGPMLVK